MSRDDSERRMFLEESVLIKILVIESLVSKTDRLASSEEFANFTFDGG